VVNRLSSPAVVAAALLLGALAPSTLQAAPNDIVLTSLIDREANGTYVVRNDDFRLLTQELAIVMTPTAMQPAETTGQSGFDFAVDYTIHQVTADAAYWVDSVEGTLEGRNDGGQLGVPILQTIGVRGRKGFPLPIPLSSEVEIGAQWVTDSSMVNLGGNVRLALNEGFRWIPDLAVMTGINRLLGTEDLDLLTVTVGGSISKGFGLVGSFNLAPFVSYQSIFMNASSRVIDPDPLVVDDVGENIVFEEVSISDPTSRMDRVSAGVRLHVAVVQLTAGVDMNFMPPVGGDRKLLLQYSVRAGLYF
jgi:hypothetical protein